ncbi:MAG: DUF4097 family beta strand repeat-containing protein [Faecousia sp.]
MKTIIKWTALALTLSLAAVLLSGCHVNLSIGIGDNLTGESYSNADAYRIGAFTYEADAVKAVEIYWRSGKVTLVESDSAELSAWESGGELPEDTAMHYLLEDGVLKIRFCASGARIQVNSNDKRLTIQVPRGLKLSVHATSASVEADTLEQNTILISTRSGTTELGTVKAESIDLSSSSGSIRADDMTAQTVKCQSSSGTLRLRGLTAENVDLETSSGSVHLVLHAAQQVKIRTSSGSTNLALPESGAEIAFFSSSGKLRTAEAFERKGDLYVFGGGESKITVDSSSGNLNIED